MYQTALLALGTNPVNPTIIPVKTDRISGIRMASELPSELNKPWVRLEAREQDTSEQPGTGNGCRRIKLRDLVPYVFPAILRRQTAKPVPR